MVHLHLFNRLLVALLGLLLFAAGAFTVAATSGWIPVNPAATSGWQWVVRELQGLAGMALFWTAAGGLLAMALGFGVMVLELRVPARSQELILAADRAGVVSVSLAGLRRLAEHVARQLPEVEGVQTEVRASRKGLAFTCRLTVAPETNTPLLVEELRRRLNQAVETHVGQAPWRTNFHVQVRPPAVVRGALGTPVRRRVQ